MIHMNEYSSIYKYYILSNYKRSVCIFVYPIVHVLFASIVIYIYTVYMYARRFKLQQTCKFVESDESPIYNIVYSTKIRISIDGREEIRTLIQLIVEFRGSNLHCII